MQAYAGKHGRKGKDVDRATSTVCISTVYSNDLGTEEQHTKFPAHDISRSMPEVKSQQGETDIATYAVQLPIISTDLVRRPRTLEASIRNPSLESKAFEYRHSTTSLCF